MPDLDPVPPVPKETKQRSAASPGKESRVHHLAERFKELYEQHYGTVYGFFTNRDYSPEDARDLTAETFFQAFSNFERFRGDSKFSTWLFSVTTNTWRNARRRMSRQRQTFGDMSLEEVSRKGEEETRTWAQSDHGRDEPLERVLQEERTRLVRAAIDKLPEMMRLCLLLRLDQGLKYREIAQLLQISTASVRFHLQQARARLRRQLGDHFD